MNVQAKENCQKVYNKLTIDQLRDTVHALTDHIQASPVRSACDMEKVKMMSITIGYKIAHQQR